MYSDVERPCGKNVEASRENVEKVYDVAGIQFGNTCKHCYNYKKFIIVLSINCQFVQLLAF